MYDRLGTKVKKTQGGCRVMMMMNADWIKSKLCAMMMYVSMHSLHVCRWMTKCTDGANDDV